MWTLKSADAVRAATALLPYTQPEQVMGVDTWNSKAGRAAAAALPGLGAAMQAAQYRGKLWMNLDIAAPCDEMLAQLKGAT